ncbi:hypothetical protein AURDEDRAFT_173650 [Auricularia subglabra TFB-10046 SS5]|nr:hypothetical protein AURDEDRAFT_173650 [Auricularia subglabra TFB-10046 SS5]
MAHRLPIELVVQVLKCAAKEEIHVDRAAVVQLALVSSFAYRLVHPVLYHTMVLTEYNSGQLYRMARDSSCAHVFRAVRRLLMVGYELQSWLSDDAHRSLLSSVTSIDAPFAAIQSLAKSGSFHPSHIAVRYHWFAGVASALPAETRSSITHITGYFPGDNTLDADDARLIIAGLPSLSHIAFEVVEFEDPFNDETDLSALDAVLRACLECTRVRAVVLRVAGDRLSFWPAVLAAAQNTRDPRVQVWREGREMASWVDEETFAVADTWAGRDIWTEARPAATWQESEAI